MEKRSWPVSPRLGGRVALVELQWDHAHADEVGAVDALEALGDDGAHAEERRALGGPVAAAPGPVFAAGQHDQRHTLVGVLHGRVEDGRLGAVGQVQGHAALGAGRQQVAQAHVGEGAAHHHFVVAPPRPVGVEVVALHPVVGQVATGRGRRSDGARRRDVVRRHRVTEQGQHPGPVHVGHRRRRHGHAREVRRVLHVGGGVLPGVGLPSGHRHLLPVLVAVEHGGVAGAEHVRRE